MVINTERNSRSQSQGGALKPTTCHRGRQAGETEEAKEGEAKGG